MKKVKGKTKINLLRSAHTRTGGRSATAGLPAGWTRRTFIVREEYLEKLEALSYWERKALKDLVDGAFKSYLSGKQFKAVRS